MKDWTTQFGDRFVPSCLKTGWLTSIQILIKRLEGDKKKLGEFMPTARLDATRTKESDL